MRSPQGIIPGLMLVLVLTGTATDQPATSTSTPSLAEIPVADMASVAPAQYEMAAVLAAGGGSPLEVALAIAGPFEGAAQHILQINESAEMPASTRITLVRDGLLDDAVRSERWDILLSRAPSGAWSIGEVKRAWRCRRGGHRESFAAALCP